MYKINAVAVFYVFKQRAILYEMQSVPADMGYFKSVWNSTVHTDYLTL